MISGIGISSLVNYKTVDAPTFIKFENRQPAVKPIWNWEMESIRNYFLSLESYINDVFAFRNELINLYSIIFFKFGVSVKPDNIIIGKNGFLFLGNKLSDVIDQTTGKNTFSDDELKAWNKNFMVRKKYLEQFGIPFYLIIAPNKHSVYPEYLPDYIVPAKQNRLQQLLDSRPPFNSINTKQAVINAKKQWGDQLFYKTDSHWSEVGAYYAYLEIIKQLKQDFPDIEPAVLKKHNFRKIFYDWNGSMTGFMNLKAIIEDSIFTIINVPGWNKNVVRTNFQGDTLDLKEYPVIAYTDQSVVVNKKKKYSVLVLRDSFSMMLAGMLNNTFGKVIYCHYEHPDGIELAKLVEQFKPDIVLYEMVERKLSHAHEIHPDIIVKTSSKN